MGKSRTTIPGLRKGKQTTFYSRRNGKGRYKKVVLDKVAGSTKKPMVVQSNTEPVPVAHASHAVCPGHQVSFDFDDPDPPPSSSSVSLRKGKRNRTEDKKKNALAWRAVKDAFVEVAITASVPITDVCMDCQKVTSNIVRCSRCFGAGGVPSHLCKDCFLKSHKHLLHIPDVWSDTKEDKIFLKEDLRPGIFKLSERPGHLHHECSSKKPLRTVTVVDEEGYHHSVQFEFCKCEAEGVTMVRYGFWPLSLVHVETACTMAFMETLRTVQLEKGISTQGFCQALKARFKAVPMKIKEDEAKTKKKEKDIATSLMNESLDAYRYFIFSLKNPVTKHTTSACPPCTKNPDPIHSIDGNQQLVQLESAGMHVADPYHKDFIFIPDDEVKDFLTDYPACDKKTTQECNNFKATDLLRSKKVNSKTKIKGIVASVCPHEFTQRALNMEHGERYAYITLMIKKLLKGKKSIKILYDVACNLHLHYKRLGKKSIQISFEGAEFDVGEFLKVLSLAIPKWHIYAHTMNCQMEYHPKIKPGFGLADGEGTERLWSKGKCMKGMTKRQRHERRIDLLTEKFIYINERLQCNIGPSLLNRYMKACYIVDNIGNVTDDKFVAEHPTYDQAKQTPEEIIALCLYKIEKFRKVTQDDSSFGYALQQINRLQKKVTTFLKGAPYPTSYGMDVLVSAIQKERLQTTHSCGKLAAEREFYLSILSCADGLNMFTRVNNRLKTINAKIQKKVDEYNQYSDVEQTTVEFSDFNEVAKISGVAPQFSKYHLRKRAIEEKQIVLSDAQRTVEYFEELITGARLEVSKFRSNHDLPHAVFFQTLVYQLVSRLSDCKKAFEYLASKQMSPIERIEIVNAVDEDDEHDTMDDGDHDDDDDEFDVQED